MKARSSDLSIQLYTTCPASSTDPAAIQRPGFYSEGRETYLRKVIDAATWSEQCGFDGILVYIDNSLVNNWQIAQIVIENTRELIPLIATQPVYMHPYWAAKTIASFGHLYGRRIALNMLAGAFRNDLIALGDPTPHDNRYDRMVEYTQVIQKLLDGSGTPVTYEGEYYRIKNVKMHPPLESALSPLVLMSGSSEAGMAAARALDAVAVRYPKPVDCYEEEPLEEGINFGLRVGIIARDDEEEAWEIGRTRFEEDRRGQLVHQMAMKTSDSKWHKDLTSLDQDQLTESYPYWMTPFQNYKTFCPYLVGDYHKIASIVARYIKVGFRTFITDIPSDKEELLHQKLVFELALKQAASDLENAR